MRTNYHHGNLRASLIQSGLEILKEDGLEGLSLRKVAKRSEVSEAAPYRHFKDKEALLAAIAEQGFIRLAQKLEHIEEQYAEDARSLFYQSASGYINFARENPDSMRVMFQKRNQGGEIQYPALQEAADDALAYLVDMVEYCQQAGLARAGHPMPIALAAWSTVHGLAMLLIDGCISPDVFQDTNEDVLIKNTLDTLIHGWM